MAEVTVTGDDAVTLRALVASGRPLELDGVQDLIGREVEAVNKKFARVETIKKFRLIEQQLTAEDEELTTPDWHRMVSPEDLPRVSALMGVRPDMVISATFIIGAALAAVAGVMWAANYGTVQHTMGFLPGLKAFTAAGFGGIGNLGGAVVGGVLLGVIEALGAGYIGDLTGDVLGSNYQDIFAFTVLILVLTLRPQGLLGERVVERA